MDAPAPNAAPSASPLRLDGLTRLRLEGDERFARTACLVLLAPTLWFSLSDVSLSLGDPGWLLARLGIRATLVVALCVGAWLIPRSASRSQYDARVLSVTLVAAIAIVGLNALRPVPAGLPLRTPLMWLFALYIGFPSRPFVQLPAPFLLTSGIVALPSFWSNVAAPGSVSGNVMVLLTVNALGVLLVRQRHAINERKLTWERDTEQLVEAGRAHLELTTLKGIIPICSYCKKVHTEIGDWQQVEAYVRARSAAEFSHGICPSCIALHHPDVLDPDNSR